MVGLLLLLLMEERERAQRRQATDSRFSSVTEIVAASPPALQVTVTLDAHNHSHNHNHAETLIQTISTGTCSPVRGPEQTSASSSYTRGTSSITSVCDSAVSSPWESGTRQFVAVQAVTYTKVEVLAGPWDLTYHQTA